MIDQKRNYSKYRYFFFLKKLEKIFPSLFDKLYLFDLINVNYKKSKLLIPNLDKINELKFYEQDIFNIDKKYFNFFDVVRVSNLLNYSYFSKTQLKKAILNIKKISKDNSIILINRTPNKKKKILQVFLEKKKESLN